VPDRIESNEVLNSGSVGNVHRATLFERFLDALPTSHTVVAALGIMAAFAVCVAILFSDNQHLAEYRSGAWAIISGYAGACITYFFGERK
jgi:hypothetical protein